MLILSRRSLALGASGLAMSALVPSVARGDERTPITGAKLDELFAEVARARKGAKSFAGPFTQTRKMGLMKAQIVSQGRVSLVLHDRLRWELFPPDEIVYFVTPDGLVKKGKVKSPKAACRRGIKEKDIGAVEIIRYRLKQIKTLNT